MKQTVLFILGLLIVIILIVVLLSALQTSGILHFTFIETVQTNGLWTTVKNLWLEHVTPLWNEHVKPLLQ